MFSNPEKTAINYFGTNYSISMEQTSFITSKYETQIDKKKIAKSK